MAVTDPLTIYVQGWKGTLNEPRINGLRLSEVELDELTQELRPCRITGGWASEQEGFPDLVALSKVDYEVEVIVGMPHDLVAKGRFIEVVPGGGWWAALFYAEKAARFG